MMRHWFNHLNIQNVAQGRYPGQISWPLLFIMLFITVACHGRPDAVKDSLARRYFEETGHTVKGEFLRFFTQYGGVESLGYPLTEETLVDGWRVQYFEKGRLEYHPENEPEYQITVGWLGELLHRRRPPIPPMNIPGADKRGSRYYVQTGHTISGDFLQYFDKYGGSVRFGLPISEPFIWDGKLAQDFQSARFFWTPDTAERVTLEKIGQLHLETIQKTKK
jgi:hypothetical protein